MAIDKKVFSCFVCILFWWTTSHAITVFSHDKNPPIQNILTECNRLLNSGKTKEAISYVDSAYAKIQKVSKIALWEKHQFKARLYLHHTNNFVAARKQIDSMWLDLKDLKNKYPSEYVKSIFTDADYYMSTQQHAIATAKYYEGITYAQKHLDICQLSDFSKMLGDFKYGQGNYREAIPYFKQAVAQILICNGEKKSMNRFIYYQANLNTIALCFEKINMVDSAISYYKKALTFIDSQTPRSDSEKFDVATSKAVVLGNLGGLYANIGKDHLAEVLLKKSIATNHQPGFPLPDAHSAQLKLTALYLKRKDFKNAKATLDLIDQDISIEKENGNEMSKQLLLRSYELKWKYYALTKSFQHANAYQTKYHNLKDSLVTKDRTPHQFEASFATIKNNYELSILKKDKLLNSLYLFGITIFALMLLLIVLMVYKNLKKSKENILTLHQLNEDVNNHASKLHTALMEVDQRKDENAKLIKMVYHDLRGPVGGITMAAELLLQEPNRSVKDAEMLEMMITSGKDALSLINNMLQISSNVTIDKQPVYMPSLIQHCSNLAQLKAVQKNQLIETDCETVTFMVDEEKLRRVILNLLFNAIKFSPTDSKIKLHCALQTSALIITCEDFGIGVKTEEIETIFDMFTQAQKVGTTGEDSFGMGLAISRQIIRAHHGEITCHPKESSGTIFKIIIPT